MKAASPAKEKEKKPRPPAKKPKKDPSATSAAPADDGDDDGDDDLGRRRATDARDLNFVVALVLGSRNLRFGLVDGQQLSRPTAIAVRTKQAVAPAAPEGRQNQARDAEIQQLLANPQYAVAPPKKISSLFDETVYTEENAITEEQSDGTFSWTGVGTQPAFVTGEKALRIPPTEPYSVKYPLHRGHFRASKDFSFQMASSLLQRIICDAFVEDLHIDAASFSSYSVSVALPDTFTHREIEEVTNLLLMRLNFKEVYFHRESVLACFGAGLMSACVVDIGASKLQVTAVFEGQIVPRGSKTLDYGGDDMTELLLHLLRTDPGHYFSFRNCSLATPVLQQQVQTMKETLCRLAPVNGSWGAISGGVPSQHLRERFPGKPTRVHHFNVSPSLVLLASRGFFVPSLFEPCDPATGCAKSYRHAYDETSSDMYAHFLHNCDTAQMFGYFSLTREFQEMTPAEQAQFKAKFGERDTADDDLPLAQLSASSSTSFSINSSVEASAYAAMDYQADNAAASSSSASSSAVSAQHTPGCSVASRVPLHVAVGQVLGRLTCVNEEARKLIASQILLVGGSSQLDGLSQEFLQQLTQLQASASLPGVQTVQFATNVKGVAAPWLSWKGATIACRTESSRELWLDRGVWQREGVRVLREYLPFSW